MCNTAPQGLKKGSSQRLRQLLGATCTKPTLRARLRLPAVRGMTSVDKALASSQHRLAIASPAREAQGGVTWPSDEGGAAV